MASGHFRHIVFYDGACGICHAFVRFALPRDSTHALDFAPIGGATFARAVGASASSLPDSVVVLARDGRLLVRSRAVALVLRELGGPWRVLGAILLAIPAPIADAGYAAIASLRRRLMPAPSGACPLVPAHLRERLLP